MDSINKRNTSDFFLPHQQLPPVEQFLKSLGNNDNQFGINTLLPEITFLRQLSIQGRLFARQGNRLVASAGNIITLTPNEGETFFIYDLNLQSSGQSTFTVTNKGIVTLSILTAGITGQGIGQYQAKFFDSIAGDGTSTWTLDVNAIAGVRVGAILVWRENTSRIRDVSA